MNASAYTPVAEEEQKPRPAARRQQPHIPRRRRRRAQCRFQATIKAMVRPARTRQTSLAPCEQERADKQQRPQSRDPAGPGRSVRAPDQPTVAVHQHPPRGHRQHHVSHRTSGRRSSSPWRAEPRWRRAPAALVFLAPHHLGGTERPPRAGDCLAELGDEVDPRDRAPSAAADPIPAAANAGPASRPRNRGLQPAGRRRSRAPGRHGHHVGTDSSQPARPNHQRRSKNTTTTSATRRGPDSLATGVAVRGPSGPGTTRRAGGRTDRPTEWPPQEVVERQSDPGTHSHSAVT